MFIDKIIQLKPLIVSVLIAFAVGSTTSGLLVHKFTSDSYKVKISQMEKAEQEEKDKIRKEADNARVEIGKMKTKLEDSHAEAEKKITELDQHYRSIVRAAGGLRDPNAVCKRTGPTGPTSTSQAGTSGQGLPETTDGENGSLYLSIETSEWLLTKFKNADKVVQQFETCKAYSLKLKEIISAYNRGDPIPDQ